MKHSTKATEKGIIFEIMKAVSLDSCNDEKRRHDCSAFEKTFCVNT